MIADEQTNVLYLADTLPKMYPTFYERFNKLLRENKVNSLLLTNTKDVWAVDYMPIQIETSKFVQFLYRPPYLTNTMKWSKTISDVDAICKELGIEPIKSKIILDGGNIVRSRNKVIITERVFIDNPNYERRKLIYELYELLEVEKIFFIPQQPKDFTGHADGMVRFLDEDTILVNDYKNENQDFYRAFENAIHNIGLNRFIIPYNVDNNKNSYQANGVYINYLQMENLIILPTFGIKEDDKANTQFDQIFAGKKVVTLESNEIANEGGILNCITWNIRTE
jgi:agmatine deiminase